MRDTLRRTTAAAHDRLDTAMRREAGWSDRADYARFLSLQYAARLPVERWLERHSRANLSPPAQTPLLADDLAEMGYSPPQPAREFLLKDASEFSVLGVAWVLAGSALGNRVILKDITRAAGTADPWPHAFLGDAGMLAFWGGLRAKIERPVSPDVTSAAIFAANATFDYFYSAAHGSACEPLPAKAHAA